MADTDMALDDVIAKNRTRTGRSVARNTPRRAGGQSKPYASPAPTNARGSGRNSANANAKSNNSTSNAKAAAPARTPAMTQRLLVANLHRSITANDIRELFSTIGPLRSSTLHFNNQGQSLGEATVVYQHPADTQRAIAEFDNRTLDGRPMRLQVILSAAAFTSTVATPPSGNQRQSGRPTLGAPPARGSNAGNNNSSNSSRGGRGNAKNASAPQDSDTPMGGTAGGRGRGRGGAGGRRGGRDGAPNAAKTPAAPLTADALNAELDTYMLDSGAGGAQGPPPTQAAQAAPAAAPMANGINDALANAI